MLWFDEILFQKVAWLQMLVSCSFGVKRMSAKTIDKISFAFLCLDDVGISSGSESWSCCFCAFGKYVWLIAPLRNFFLHGLPRDLVFISEYWAMIGDLLPAFIELEAEWGSSCAPFDG